MSENKTYLWEVDRLSLLRNQILTGYKTVRNGTEISFVKLTEQEVKDIEEEIKYILSNNI